MSAKQKRKVSKGTGKRYTSDKPKPQAAPPVRTAPPPASYAEKALRSAIIRFGISEQFKDDLERAFEQYMGPGSVQTQDDKKILVFDENDNELPGFQEWFYTDYRLDSGDRIIDLFAKEIGPQLNATQRKILEDWLVTNRLRLLETQSVEPGIGETMQDLLSGEVLRLNDISYSYSGSRWAVFLGRTLLTEGRWSFTGSGILLTPLEKSSLLKIAQELWSDYQQEHPQADLLDFYRDYSLELYQAGKKIQQERNKPKAIYSAEGHPALSARADFAIQGDPLNAESALDQAEEFVFQNEQETGEYSGCLHYIWLLRGRSSVPEAQDSPKGLMLTGNWTLGPGEPDFRTLGDLFLCSRSLTLECLSRERLEAGKQLLSQILGDKLRHQEDQFEELRELSDREVEDDDVDDDVWGDPSTSEADLVEEELIERMTLRWLDQPVHNGLSPRQLAQTPEGRAELHEILKSIEYLEGQALKSGKRPPMRMDIITKELGL